jgi:hypothetical protein
LKERVRNKAHDAAMPSKPQVNCLWVAFLFARLPNLHITLQCRQGRLFASLATLAYGPMESHIRFK